MAPGSRKKTLSVGLVDIPLILLGDFGVKMHFQAKKHFSAERKNGHISVIFWGGPKGKVVAPSILVICPVDKNRDYHTKN